PEVAGLRIFAGYAGWSPGQLEGEIDTGSWYVVESEHEDVFTDSPAGLWRRVLRRQPEPLRWVAWFPKDPEQN
ncbi:YqgE/AlgH family protein, partial [Phycicoccus flavus]